MLLNLAVIQSCTNKDKKNAIYVQSVYLIISFCTWLTKCYKLG